VNTTSAFWRSLVALALAIVAGCAAIEQPPAPPAVTAQAEALFAAGDYLGAASAYQELLASPPADPPTAVLKVRLAEALLLAEDYRGARLALAEIDSADPTLLFEARILLARIALAERRPSDALAVLSEPPHEHAAIDLLAAYHGLRGQALHLLGNHIESAREYMLRESYLTDADMIRENQLAIWQSLAMLTVRGLQQLRTAPPPDILSGWMELVEIAKAYQLQPMQLQEQLDLWRQRYPAHPAMADILSVLQARRQEDLLYPQQIGLLLPLGGKYAKAAEAVRDGFLAAYFAHAPRAQQSIRVYDVGSDPTNVLSVYQRAVSEGAELIVGPLDKDAVNILAQQPALPVPTLALNTTDTLFEPPDALFQFSLSPEDEARQVAERTWLDGYVYAAALVPSGAWGERMLSAFQERWQALGGELVDQRSYNPQLNDFSGSIRALLNVDSSDRRHRELEQLFNRNVEFTARRRQDIDFVFLAAYPRQARLIRPQLKFYHAADVPVYATSHVFTGSIDQELDRDLDGVAFADMPWVLAEESSHQGLRVQLEDYITRTGRGLQRLYALGIDAFNVIAALNPLKNYAYERFDGETGSLSMGPSNRLHRQLTWVRFRGGRPVPLEASE